MRSLDQINKELFAMQEFVESLDGSDTKNITVLSEILLSLSGKLARSANLVAEAGMIASTAKRKAYLNFSETAKVNGFDFSASIVKDFVATQISEELQCYEYSQRINAAITHVMDSMRSILSAAKTEYATLSYQT